MSRTPPSASPSRRGEHLNVIDPAAGKRYKLHIKGAVHKLTIGKVKRCLESASSCQIAVEDMVVKLNGVPLSADRDVCGALGIFSGATLTVEEGRWARGGRGRRHTGAAAGNSSTHHHHQDREEQPSLLSSSGRGGDWDGNYPQPQQEDDDEEEEDDDRRFVNTLASPQHRMLEAQTLQAQEDFVHTDSRTRGDALRRSIARLDSGLDAAAQEKRRLERQRRAAEAEIAALRQREQAAAEERDRLAVIHAAEERRAAERAADLARRREELRGEQERVRHVAQLKLANAQRRALLESQRAAHAAEQRRAEAAERALEAEDRQRQLELRAREIDMEHQRLKYLRGQRQLADEKRRALEDKADMYARLGLEPPPSLQQELSTLAAAGEGDEPPQGLLMYGQRPGSSSISSSAAHADPLAESVPRITAADGAAPFRGGGVGGQHSNNSLNGGRYPAPPPPASLAAAAHNPNSGNGSNYLQQQQHHEQPLVPTLPDGMYYDPAENAAENLRRLGDDLGLAAPLAFDESNTCVISVEDAYTLLVTYDAATERLYLYSTLLTAIPGGQVNDTGAPSAATAPTPAAAQFRLKLYEYLLEASLLGRDMCGGGIGASLKNDFILMSTSLYMPTCQPWALRTVAPQFLQCLQHWRERVAAFLANYDAAENAPYLLHQPPQQQRPPSRGTDDGGVYGSNSRRPAGASSSMATAAPPHHRSPSLFFSREDFAQQQQQQQQHSGHREVPVLGLEVADAGAATPTAISSSSSGGVVVLAAAGPAALAGLQAGDVVTAIDDSALRGLRDFQRVAAQLQPGQVIALHVWRRRAGGEGGRAQLQLRLQVGAVQVPAL